MIVTDDRRRRLNAVRSVNDVQQGDLVRRKGHRGVGIIEEEPAHGFAWVGWDNGRRDYLPLVALRKVKPGGSDFDVRKQP